MEEEPNPNLANINIDEITASLQDTVADNNITDINGDMNENLGYQPKSSNNNNQDEDIEMNIPADQELDIFLFNMVKRELEALEQNNHRDPLIKKSFNDLNDTISKIHLTNHIKEKKQISKSKAEKTNMI